MGVTKRGWTNPESTQARRPRGRVTGKDELEMFREDVIPHPSGAPRKSKSQRSSASSSATSGSSKTRLTEFFQEQIQLNREAKKESLDRELAVRLAVVELQKRNEDLKILTFDTTGMNPDDAAKIEALKEKTQATALFIEKKRLFLWLLMISNVIVGNRSSIPVTHSGHVQIPNLYRPLHLRNVLVTPNIIKNLVSVRKFTTNNKCSIDFDPYGFTVRDYHTRQTLLRCDSTGDLYPLHVAASAFALLTNNNSLWHQRLGHPGDA
ncbi:hypothetical protein Tco_0174798, partial [Tanacetum coccineum]